jgi:hypothetical protein
MSRPTPWQSFIGNPFLCIPLMLGAIYVGYLWMVGQAPWWVALFAVIAASGVAKAAQRVRAYSAWKREWDGEEASERGLRLPSGRAIRNIIGIACWAWLAWMSLDLKSSPTTDLAVMAFWLGTAVLVAVGICRAIRAVSMRTNRNEDFVGVCMPAASQSDAVHEAVTALPTYCLHLVRRN